MEKENLYHFIYKTTNIKNGKFYIGMHSTNNLNDGYLGSGKHLRNSVYYHGKENFKRDIIEFLPDRSSLKEREKEIINSDLLKEEKCMNIKEGGEGGCGFYNEKHRYNFFSSGGRKVRQMFSKIHQDKMKNDIEYRNRVIEKLKGYKTFLGKKHSLETIQKMKKSKNVGNKNSQYGTCWITNGKENKKLKNTEFIPENWYLGRVIKKI
jgi:hypothetical protein